MLSRQRAHDDISGLPINRIVQYAHLPLNNLVRASGPIKLTGGRYAFESDPSYTHASSHPGKKFHNIIIHAETDAGLAGVPQLESSPTSGYSAWCLHDSSQEYLGYDATQSGGNNAVADRDVYEIATDAVGDNTNSCINTNQCVLNDMAATPPFPLPIHDNDVAPTPAQIVRIERDTSTVPQDVLGICASHSHARTYHGFCCVHASGFIEKNPNTTLHHIHKCAQCRLPIHGFLCSYNDKEQNEMMCYKCSPVELRDMQARMIMSKPPEIPTQPDSTPVPQLVPTPNKAAQCPVVHDAGDGGGKLLAMPHRAVQMQHPPTLDQPWTEPEIPYFDFWYKPLPEIMIHKLLTKGSQ